TSGTPPTVAAKKATSQIPIVFAPAGDPLASGLVASLARPGGNITGLSNQTADIAGKRVELLARACGADSPVGQSWSNPTMPPPPRRCARSRRRTGTLGIEVLPLEIGRAEDIGPAFETIKGRADGLYVVIDSLVTTHLNRINTLALGARLPTMHGAREL